MNKRTTPALTLMVSVWVSVSLSQELPGEEPGDPLGPFEPIVVYNSPERPDIRIHPTSYHEIDLSIASFSDSKKLLVGLYKVGPPGTGISSGVAYAYSTNGGSTWQGNDLMPEAIAASRPSVAFNADGNAFFLYREPYDPGEPELWLHKSLDGGTTWLPRIEVVTGYPGDPSLPLTPHMTIDATAGSPYANNIYIGYTEFWSYPAPVKIKRCTSGPGCFVGTYNISAPVTSYFSQGVRLAVGSNGHVYAVWAIYAPPPSGIEEEAIGFNRSTNGGVAWLTAQRAIEVSGIRGEWTHKNPQGNPIDVFGYPSIAVDRSGGPSNGRVYVAWPDQRNGDPDIYFAAWNPPISTDQGGTWSFPKRVNDDAVGNGKDQWMPSITVTDQGVIMIGFYDSRRNDSNNQLTETWVAQSVDGGNTFKNYRSSDAAFTPYPVSSSGYMGSYMGITSIHGYTLPCWPDSRPTQSPQPYQAYIERFGTLKISSPAAGNWNMWGVANLVYDFHKSAVYPTVDPNSISIFTSGGYQVAPDPLDNYRGYWVPFTPGQTVTYMGAPVPSSDMGVQNGWNMIGSISEPVSTGSVIQIPSGIVLSQYFKYEAGYVPVTTLEPGRGYWVKTSPGVLRLVAPEGPESGTVENPLAALDRFSVSDGKGRTQEMYVRNDSFALDPEGGDDEEMPPDPPGGGGFNVSIGPGNFIESVSLVRGEVGEVPIAVKAADYPITLSWDIKTENGLQYFMVRAKSGKGEERIRIEGSGGLSMESLSDGIIHLETELAANANGLPKASAEAHEATVYSLRPNYPNPFNPSTEIKFSLSEPGNVTLVVFDVLGREIITLVKGNRNEGLHSVTWDGTNAEGRAVGSGIYFARLAITDAFGSLKFLQLNKLILSK